MRIKLYNWVNTVKRTAVLGEAIMPLKYGAITEIYKYLINIKRGTETGNSPI